MTKIAIDSDIFFFAFGSRRKDINPNDVRRFLKGLSGDPRIELFVPLSVLGESVIECLRGERVPDGRHNIRELYVLIELWGELNLLFLYPNDLVADVCSNMVERYRRNKKDFRLSDTDLVHLGYALAHGMDYFLTTDTKLKHYIPKRSGLKVINFEEAKRLF